MMAKSASWAAPCPGTSVLAPEFPALTLPCPATPVRGYARHGGDQPFGSARQTYDGVVRLREVMRLQGLEQPTQQLVQDERQGWSVSEDIATGLSALTAHMGAANGGVSGPYPWRRPV